MVKASVPVPLDDERLGVVVTETEPGQALDIARRFVLAGHVVVVGASRLTDAERAARLLSRNGGAAFGAWLDITDMSSVHTFAATAVYLAGPIDVMVVGSSAATEANSDDQGLAYPIGIGHLVTQLVSATPSRPGAELLVVTCARGPADRPPNVCPSSRFTAALDESAALRDGERTTDSESSDDASSRA